MADQWETHEVQVNIAAAMAGCSLGSAPAKSRSAECPRQARHLGAGPLSFEMIEPFRHWRMRFDGIVNGWTVTSRLREADPRASHRCR